MEEKTPPPSRSQGQRLKLLLICLLVLLLTLVFGLIPKDIRQKKANIHASTHVSQEVLSNFSFEKYTDWHELNKDLGNIFPFGTPIADIDKVLVDQGGAFRTESLIGDDKTQTYRNGLSSGKNYVFYYKPTKPAGKNGWEETDTGWVIKVIHGRFPQKGYKSRALGIGGGGEGLLEFNVLAAPKASSFLKSEEAIKLVKELLQYKIDTTRIDLFDAEEWKKLVEEIFQSPCKNNPSYQCLMDKSLSLLGIEKGKLIKQHYLVFLKDRAVRYKDKELANLLLDQWPAEKDWPYGTPLRGSSTRMGLPPKTVDLYYHEIRTPLYFVTGRYDEGKKTIIDLQEKYKAGTDFGAIDALVTMGELDKAYEIAGLSLEWQREIPDGNEGSSAIGHCQNYEKTRPTAMEDLAMALAAKGDLDKAYKTAQMLGHYWTNDAFGQKSFCYTGFAINGYLSAAAAIIKSYIDKNEREKAVEIFKELRQTIETKVKNVNNTSIFMKMSFIAAKNGMDGQFDEIIRYMKNNDNREYKYHSDYDPLALAYALFGDDKSANERIEGFQHVKKKENDKEEDALSRMMRGATEEEIKESTYEKIAYILRQLGEERRADEYLNKARSLKPETSKNNAAVQQHAAELSKKGDWEELENLIPDLSKEIAENSMDGSRSSYIEDIRNDLLAGEKFDLYLNLVDEAGRQRSKIFKVTQAEFSEGLRQTTNMDEKEISRQWRMRESRIKSVLKFEERYEDAQPQLELIHKLLIEYQAGLKLPTNIIDQVWPRHIRNCRGWDHVVPEEPYRSLSANEVMAGCLLSLIKVPKSDRPESIIPPY